MLTIDIWSDYTCPYCFIGKQQLYQALDELGITDYKIAHHVYLLDPGKVNHPERTFLEGLKLSPADLPRTEKKLKEIEAMAAAVGLHYDMAHILDIGTIDAHRLTLWAQTKDKHMELNERIFRANFEECQDISSHELLAQYAQEVGLDIDEAREVLADKNAYLDPIYEDFEIADEKEIDLVPHYTFNDEVEIMGIMTVQAIKKHIQEALEH